MKIRQIEYENFRNFRNHGVIRCSTDGKITVIYGKNGDGKTTLHQLFQWVLYGQVHFNKTATDHLYNHAYESDLSFGDVFEVMGRIDFEHAGEEYSCTRKSTFKKGLRDSERVKEDFSLYKMNNDHDWRSVENATDTIEMLLPSGLSEYFFFDGESMIADLRMKGKDSAGKLRKALFSMFDLDILESAINHIGRTELKTSVLGKLYLSKGTITSGAAINAVKANIENAQNKIKSSNELLAAAEEQKKKDQALIAEISEQIGSQKSKADYEMTRKKLKSDRDFYLKNATAAQNQYGDTLIDMVPRLFVSKAVQDAKRKIHLQIEQNKLPAGVSKKLVKYLLSESTDTCICGNPLCEKEKQHIEQYLAMLPPKSYTSLYQDFTKTAQLWGKGFDREQLESYIIMALDNYEKASQCDIQIRELDDAEKKAPKIENLIVARQDAEADLAKQDQAITDLTTHIKKLNLYLNKQMKDFDDLTKSSEANAIAEHKIAIMQEVLSFFQEHLNHESVEFSKLLEQNVQDLIDCMLTSKRTVRVSPEFSVRVVDSFEDESKSEGQFAVVSFAYIGGIFKLLQSQDSLSNKEYPLVLDGPFSKLDPDQRQNVIDTIPQFAPQIILFSKDDLNDVICPDKLGRVWTIVSNSEKNEAHVEEGHLWK